MMRYAGFIMLSVCLAASGAIYAAAAQEKGGATAAPESGQGAAGKQNQQPSRRPRKPVSTFKPTERIRADSAVSFPVDI